MLELVDKHSMIPRVFNILFGTNSIEHLCHRGTHPALVIISMALHVHLGKYSICEGYCLAYGGMTNEPFFFSVSVGILI